MKVWPIFKKELRLYFASPVAYVVIAIFLLIAGYFFYSIFAFYTMASMQMAMNPAMARDLNVTDNVMRPLFSNLGVILLLLMPILTMRLFAEERRSGTIELLLTYPVRDGAVLAGKYLAALALYALMLALTLLYPAMLLYFTRVEWGPLATGYLGLLLLGSCFLAVGLFASSLTENQNVAAITTFGILLMFWVLGWSADYAGVAWGGVLRHLSLIEHFDNFGKGVLDTKDLIYYLDFTAVALVVSLNSLLVRRWKGDLGGARIPGSGWLGAAAAVLVIRFVRRGMVGEDFPFVQYGFIAVAVLLALVGLYQLLRNLAELQEFVSGPARQAAFNMALVIAIVLGIVAVVEALSYRHSGRIDVTENRRHSLSPQTVQLLRGLATDVNAVGFFRSDQPGKRVAEDLLKQYAGASRGKFTWKLVDPDREPALARRYGVESYGTIVLETKTKSEKVLDAEEEKLTNGLVKVTREGKRVVYVLQGHGEPELASTERPGFSEARTAMERANYEVKPLVLAREGKVPDDASVVIEGGARVELFPPELEALGAYLARGGKLLVALHPPFPQRVQDAGLRRLLATYGVEMVDDLIIEPSPIGRLFGIGPEVPIVQQYESHPITRDLGGVTTLFPLTRSLGQAKGAGGQAAFAALARTSAQAWGERNRSEVESGQVKLDPDDSKGPLTVAVVATKDKSRLVVYGSANLAVNQFLNVQGNRDFFLNTVSWLAEQEDQISIRPRDSRQAPVVLTGAQAQAVFWLPVVILPGLVLAAGAAVVVRRRGSG